MVLLIKGRFWTAVNSRTPSRSAADIVFLGDSNIAQTYLPPWRRASALVAREVGARVANLGRNGWAAQDLLGSTVLDRALSLGARTAVIGFGINDSKHTTPAAFAGDLANLIGRARSTDMEPILVTTVWCDYPVHYRTEQRNLEFAPFNDVTREVGADQDVPVVDMWRRIREETAAGNWDVRLRSMESRGRTVESGWFDNVHYNARGSRMLADELLSTFAGAGPSNDS